MLALTAAWGCSSSSPPLPPPGPPSLEDAGAPDPSADAGPLTPPDATPPDTAEPDAPDEPDGPPPVIDPAAFCALGTDVAGAVVPGGFCLRRFATVTEARTLAFAPNGDLFVGAPSTPTPGGAGNGPGAIVVLTDDDHDGVAESHTYADNLADVHGLAIGGGYVHFTTKSNVWRTPYTDGQRQEVGPRESMNAPDSYANGGRWAHGLARSTTGDVITSRGEYSTCGTSPGGEIARFADGGLQPIATGFRNPMYLRCHRKDPVCAATELGEDNMTGAREKLVSLRPGTSYGYPCCYSLGTPTSVAPPGACAAITAEDAKFVLSDTPFGFDWETDQWPEPYHGGVFVALHGSFYTSPSWAGARVVYARTDPTTHMPVEDWRDFVRGFGPQGGPLERPSDVAFAPDGRLFFSDDHGGGVYWVAPITLRRPN